MTAPKMRKRCVVCGAVAMMRRRARVCRQKRPGFSIYACGGRLVPAPIQRAPRPAPTRGLVLARKLADIKGLLGRALTRQKKAARAVAYYSGRVLQLERQIAALPTTTAPSRAYFDEAQP